MKLDTIHKQTLERSYQIQALSNFVTTQHNTFESFKSFEHFEIAL